MNFQVICGLQEEGWIVKVRPSTFYDATPSQWIQIDFTQGFFLNMYTPYQPLALQALISPTSLCSLPLCKTQRKPWNGLEGSGGGPGAVRKDLLDNGPHTRKYMAT